MSASVDSVFINAPYDRKYQPLFVTLVSTLVCLGQTPRCVLEIRETGTGRLARISELLGSCQVSIHDLSRVGPPPRFNMPFELGLACARKLAGQDHDVVVLDAVPHRLDKTLSDYKGRDPLIHYNRCDELVTCLADCLDVPNEPPAEELRSTAALLRKTARNIAESYQSGTVFRPAAFRKLVVAAVDVAQDRGFIAP